MNYLKQITKILCISILLVSCGNDSKKVNTAVENAAETIKNTKKVSDGAPAMQESMQQLRNKIPLTKEQFESWLPDTLLEMPLSFSQINFMPGLGSCGATYKLGNKRIRVMIIDGAGEKGAGSVGPYRMSSKVDIDTKDERGYTKTVVFDGVKAKKSYVKTSGLYSLSMFYVERFGVDIEMHNFSEDSLEQIVKELNLNKLKPSTKNM